MSEHYADRRKIDPARILPGGTELLPDGTPNDGDRVEIGPTALAFAEWDAAGLLPPDLAAMRRYRWERLTAGIVAAGCDALLMFDPLNIRYATDSTNMQLWNSHNPFRACLLCADGHMVLFDYKHAPFLSSFNPLVAEVRGGASFFYAVTGDRGEAAADAFAGQIAEIMAAHCGAGRRLAIDKIQIAGLRALEAAGFTVTEGEAVTERVRAIKGPDEILAMRCAMLACEAAMTEMEAAARAGVPLGSMSEDDIWAVLHAENIRRGGEWIETRLLASGPRTNPWFQECGPRIVRPNEIVAFDTDLIGAYGICVDISRTWWIGDAPPRADMVAAFAHARAHMDDHISRLRPGVTVAELTFGGHRLAPEFWRQKYSCKLHGVGLCDEWPFVPYEDGHVEGAFDVVLEPGMVLCAEALVSPEGGDFSIKLEDQVLITEDGCENLTHYPFDAALSAMA
ncbi:dimethylsulfonioproprionate lyase DddP [Pseudoroseicyclus sp. CXY001]|uniref:dimethylsulfonioproprionate lyase DddP n=1 Tax=Pseudoroseicyclus sp. CXY001 TaxID=3242492 RepID=UPI0035712AC8